MSRAAPWILLTTVVVWLVASQAGSVLDGMRPPGAEPLGRAALTSGSDIKVEAVREQWNAWFDQATTDDFPLERPSTVLAVHVGFDTLFVLLYGLVAWGWFIWLREGRWGAAEARRAAIAEDMRRLSEHDAPAGPRFGTAAAYQSLHGRIEESRKAWRWVLGGTPVLIGLLVVADLLENWAMWRTFDAGDWVALAQVAHTVRVLLAFVVVLLLAYVATFAPTAGDLIRGPEASPITAGARIWRDLVSVQAPLLLLAVLAAFLLFAEQFPDVARRVNWVHLGAALYLALGLALLVWVIVSVDQRRATTATPPESRLSVYVFGAWAAAAAVVSWLGVGGARAWGLWIPPVIALVLWFAGRPLRHRGGLPQRERAGRTRLDYAPTLAALVLVIVGAALIKAAAPEVILFERRRRTLGVLVVLAAAAAFWFLARWLVTRNRAPATQPAPNRLRESKHVMNGLVLGGVLLGPAVFYGVSGTDLSEGGQLSSSDIFVVGVLVVALGGALHSALSKPVAPGAPAGGAGLIRNAFGTDEAPGWSAWGWVLAAAGASVLVLAAWWFVSRPLSAPQEIGSMGVMLVFSIILLVVVQLATTFADRSPPPRVLDNIGVNRTPVLLLALVWVALSSTMSTVRSEDFHDARLVPSAQLGSDLYPAIASDGNACLTQGPAESVEAVWDRWRCVNDVGGAGGLQPMIFVTAWGGGIRAAAWTASVMDCVFEADTLLRACGRGIDPEHPFARSDAIFLASGVSGGAMGLFEYAAFLTHKQLELRSPAGRQQSNWVAERVHDDFLAPALARLLFVDVPGSLVGVGGQMEDRADLLERAWEAPWRDDPAEPGLFEQGMLALWQANEHIPLIAGNGMSEVDDCQFVTSPLSMGIRPAAGAQPAVDCISLDPFVAAQGIDGRIVASRDLTDFLCDGDVRLSTASMLAARFPFITPSGRVQRMCTAEDELTETAFVVDGGYLEDAGAMTAFQVWSAVEPLVSDWNASGNQCVVPVMIHMENGYDPKEPQEVDPRAPNEWLLPLLNVRVDGLRTNARTRAALEFNVPLTGPGGAPLHVMDTATGRLVDRYAFVTTYAHPGVSAPLGWTLSDQALEDLQDQLEVNATALDRIAGWFGELECVTVRYLTDGGTLARSPTSIAGRRSPPSLLEPVEGKWVRSEVDLAGWEQLTPGGARDWIDEHTGLVGNRLVP